MSIIKKAIRGGWERITLFGIIAGIAVLICVGIFIVRAMSHESTDDAFVDAHIVRIAPNVAGTLIEVADLDNRHVTPGRLLAVIQPNGPEATLAEAPAAGPPSLQVRTALAAGQRTICGGVH